MINTNKYPIDDEWFCSDCESWHNCLNCPRMDELLMETNWELINVLKTDSLNEEKEKIIKNKAPLCSCWMQMERSKLKSWPIFICNDCYYK